MRLIPFLCIFIFNVSFSQVNISGKVQDKVSKANLAFVTVATKQSKVTAITGDNGEFHFNDPAVSLNDTAVFMLLGYSSVSVPLTKLLSDPLVYLSPSAIDLNEILIKPMSAEMYIRLARRRAKANYPSDPFMIESFYKEVIDESNQRINQKEALIRSYIPSFQDTNKNQHQLLLYRGNQSLTNSRFFNEEKKNKKAGGQEKELLFLGGPESSLQLLDIFRSKQEFIDTSKFRQYVYKLEAPTTFNNREVLVVSFNSKKVEDHLKQKGKIFLDELSMAIVRIEFSGDFVVPFYMRPLLFVAGVKINEGVLKMTTNYQLVDNKWYPSFFTWRGDASVEKVHWFRNNEVIPLMLQQILSVNKILNGSVVPIPAAKRLNNSKPLSEQVNNEGRNWNQVNTF